MVKMVDKADRKITLPHKVKNAVEVFPESRSGKKEPPTKVTASLITTTIELHVNYTKRKRSLLHTI